MSKPTIIQKRAIDVTPNDHGIYCTVANSDPFVNPIVSRRWSDDGSKINIMLDSHNFYSWGPEEMVDVVEIPHQYAGSPGLMAKCIEEDRERMAKRRFPPLKQARLLRLLVLSLNGELAASTGVDELLLQHALIEQRPSPLGSGMMLSRIADCGLAAIDAALEAAGKAGE